MYPPMNNIILLTFIAFAISILLTVSQYTVYSIEMLFTFTNKLTKRYLQLQLQLQLHSFLPISLRFKSNISIIHNTMLHHIVLFKFGDSKELLDGFYSGVQTLKQIDGVVSINAGEQNNQYYSDYADRSNGYTHVLHVLLRDKEALENYDKSEFHNEVKKTFILPCLNKEASAPLVMAIDYESALPST